MLINGLFHVAIKTSDLDLTRRRYVAGASFFDAPSYPGLGARVSA